jgi:hypothetical protein
VSGADGRGILYPARLPSFERLPAPDGVRGLVVHFWVPEWSLPPGRVSRQHVLSFPATNLVVEGGVVGHAGPTTRRSHRDLSGTGWAVGALLRPAAVPLLTDDPAGTIDRYAAVDAPDLHRAVAAAMSADADPARRRADAVAVFSAWLEERAPEPAEEAVLANRMSDLLTGDPTVLTTTTAAERLHVSERTLQRLAARRRPSGCATSPPPPSQRWPRTSATPTTPT